MENKVLKNNILYLKKEAGLTNKQFWELLNFSESKFKAIFYGNENLVFEDELLICEIFNVSIDQLRDTNLEEASFSCGSFNYLSMRIGDCFENNIFSFFMKAFIVLFNIKNINDKEYQYYYKNLKNILNLSKNMDSTVSSEVIDCFVRVYKETGLIEICINCLSAILFCWLCVGNQFSSIEKNFVENNLCRAVKNEEKINREKEKFLDSYYFLMIDLLSDLQKSNKYTDFIPYFLAIKTLFNFFPHRNNKLSNVAARTIGNNLIAELCLTGNKYAKKFDAQGYFL